MGPCGVGRGLQGICRIVGHLEARGTFLTTSAKACIPMNSLPNGLLQLAPYLRKLEAQKQVVTKFLALPSTQYLEAQGTYTLFRNHILHTLLATLHKD